MLTRCPHCKAEVAAGAAFCAACGSSLPEGGASGQVESPSLFELPVSGRARVVRIAIVLTLDAVLAGSGLAMMASYFSARAEAAAPNVVAGADAEPAHPQAEVQVAPPRVVRPGQERPPVAEVPTTKPPATTTPHTGGGSSGGSKPPVDVPGGTDDPGAVLGGISRRPDAAVPLTPPAVTPPDAAVASTPPPASPPDAASAPPAPDVPPEANDAEQTLAGGVQRTVEGHMGQVRRCWENIAKASADSNLPEGTIEIQFAVLASGSPQAVQVVQNETGSPQLGECVVALVNSWSFPNHDGDPVVFVWPFFFKASK